MPAASGMIFSAPLSLFGDAPHAFHGDGLRRPIVKAALAPGFHRCNLVDDIHAVGYAREHGVAEIAARVIEKIVVLQVDEELRSCAVDVVGARHRQRAALVLQAVVRLVIDRRLGFILSNVLRHAPAYDVYPRKHGWKHGTLEHITIYDRIYSLQVITYIIIVI